MERVEAARPAGVLVGTVGGENESCQGVYADAVCCGRSANLGLLPNCGVSGCGLAGDGVLAIAAAGVKTWMTGSEVT